jgi:hypothetical protein
MVCQDQSKIFLMYIFLYNFKEAYRCQLEANYMYMVYNKQRISHRFRIQTRIRKSSNMESYLFYQPKSDS